MVVSRNEKRGLRIGRWLPVMSGGCNGLGGSSPPLSFECFVSQNGVGSRLRIHKLLINLQMVAERLDLA